MELGYARVATAKQDLDRQVDAVQLPAGGHTIAETVAKTGIARSSLYRHLSPRPAESVTARDTAGVEPDPET
jgi:hypothetical protein